MSTATTPGEEAGAPKAKGNRLGLLKNDYKGLPSTLCSGCGHDSISNQIIQAAFDLSLDPQQVVKLSGIGCSSKSPAYFLNRSHGINVLHGRMPSIATGTMLANHTLLALGVSGDGDTGSIGLGQFKHAVRRNTPMVYIVENNGVYGLTKGQFSATADQGQEIKYAGVNDFQPLDLCLEAIIAGAGFVARSFAGDAKQVRELLKAAMSYSGIAVLDIISPCVTFNNHEQSTKSYPYGKEHEEALHDISFVPAFDEIQIEQEEGTVQAVKLHDGPTILLRKLASSPDASANGDDPIARHDPTSKLSAMRVLEEANQRQEFLTGLLYINESQPTLTDVTRLPETPLAHLPEAHLRSTPERLAAVMGTFA